MKQGQNRLIIVMAVIAGFLGGMLSNQLFQAKDAYAKKEDDKWKVIVAQEFRVVDVAKLLMDPRIFQVNFQGLPEPVLCVERYALFCPFAFGVEMNPRDLCQIIQAFLYGVVGIISKLSALLKYVYPTDSMPGNDACMITA